MWTVDDSPPPEWNPFLVRVEAELAPDAPVAMSVRVGGLTLQLDARILSVSPGRQLRWVGPISSVKALLFSGEHYFLIQEIADDRVRFVHGEEFGGVLPPLVAVAGRDLARPTGFNHALKLRIGTPSAGVAPARATRARDDSPARCPTANRLDEGVAAVPRAHRASAARRCANSARSERQRWRGRRSTPSSTSSAR